MSMKKKLIALLVIASCAALAISLMAAYTADSVLGIWLVPKEDARVTIMKCGDKFCGKVTWLKTPEDLDTKNPDPAKKKNKILGMDMLWGFTFKNDEWVDGHIYDPDSGNTYKCKMWLKSENKLNVKGYVGIPLFGRSEIWTRVK
jgi:uncharacterized protein (DUF2147 family)